MGHKDDAYHSLKTFRRSLQNSRRPYLYSILTLVLIYLIYRWISTQRFPKKFIDTDRMQKVGQPPVFVGLVGNSESDKSFQPPPSIQPSVISGNVVRVEAYMEAQCGDSTRFMRRQLWPTYEKFSGTGRIDLAIYAFGKASCQPEAGDYNCRCQHGQRECDLNQLMNCVQDFYNNDAVKYMPALSCIQGKTDLDYAKDYCIANNPELPLDVIMKCATGRRGRLLMALAGQKTAQLQPPLTNVPLIFVNGEKSIDAFYEFQETICEKMNPKPEQCFK